MNVDELLNLIDDALEESAVVPFSGGKRMVDVDRVRDLMDEIRRSLPAEIKQAKAIVSDRSDILSGAKKEAESMIQRAENRARTLVQQEEITRQAQQMAAEAVTAAQQQAREMRASVTDYCEGLLKATEERLVKSAGDVKNARAALRQRPRNDGGQGQG